MRWHRPRLCKQPCSRSPALGSSFAGTLGVFSIHAPGYTRHSDAWQTASATRQDEAAAQGLLYVWAARCLQGLAVCLSVDLNSTQRAFCVRGIGSCCRRCTQQAQPDGVASVIRQLALSYEWRCAAAPWNVVLRSEKALKASASRPKQYLPGVRRTRRFRNLLATGQVLQHSCNVEATDEFCTVRDDLRHRQLQVSVPRAARRCLDRCACRLSELKALSTWIACKDKPHLLCGLGQPLPEK